MIHIGCVLLFVSPEREKILDSEKLKRFPKEIICYDRFQIETEMDEIDR